MLFAVVCVGVVKREGEEPWAGEILLRATHVCWRAGRSKGRGTQELG
jgi:hypothetical protein